MPYRFAFLATFSLVLTSLAPAQFSIHNEATARAHNPAADSHVYDAFSAAQWNADGRETDLASSSESHPWDPPINIAMAKSHFIQTTFGTATLRSESFVISDYSGIGSTLGYSAETKFRLSQRLIFDAGGAIGGMVSVQTFVPMHGLIAARGNTAPNTGGHGIGHAESRVQGFSSAGALLDSTAGTLDLDSTDYNVFTWNATGDWLGAVSLTNVNLPTGSEPRSLNGIELSSIVPLNLGLVPTGMVTEFRIDFEMNTSAFIGSSTGQAALADFSGTGGFEVKAFDSGGNPFTDFSIQPAAVPEPASYAALGLGLAGILRRRLGRRR